MIDTIEIFISNGIIDRYKVLIIPKNNTCYINDKKYMIDNKLVNSILDIIVTWKYEYGTANTLDAEEFTINIYSDKKTAYHGKGIFPMSYGALLKIIGDIEYDR